MPRWNKARPAVLLAALAAILGVLARALLAPAPLEHPLPAFPFPAASPIRGWEPGVPDDDSEASYVAEREGVLLEVRMRFIADIRALHISDSDLEVRMLPVGDLPLDVGMRYLVDAAGRIQGNEKSAPPVRHRLEIVKSAAGDFRGFWDDGRRLHLSALIGSNGHTAATSRELLCNIYLRQFGPGRIAKWFLGETPLPDKRCILADISLLAPDLPRAETRVRLEQAWSEWYGWCAPTFTKACEGTD
jgi:cyanosortase A-associated protein